MVGGEGAAWVALCLVSICFPRYSLSPDQSLPACRKSSSKFILSLGLKGIYCLTQTACISSRKAWRAAKILHLNYPGGGWLHKANAA